MEERTRTGTSLEPRVQSPNRLLGIAFESVCPMLLQCALTLRFLGNRRGLRGTTFCCAIRSIITEKVAVVTRLLQRCPLLRGASRIKSTARQRCNARNYPGHEIH